MGVVAPNGAGIANFCKALQDGRSGIVALPQLQAMGFGSLVGGVPQIQNSEWFPVLQERGLDTASQIVQYAAAAAFEAWTMAGFEIPAPGEGSRLEDTGLIIGSGIGSIDIFGDRVFPMTNDGQVKRMRSTTVEHSMLSGPGAAIAGILGLGNKVSFNSSACSTGTEAIIEAAERIREGKATRMLAGAADAFSPYCWSPFDALRVTSRKFNDTPEQASRPMSATAAGFVPAAGGGVLVLEDYETAVSRGATIIAEYRGGFVNCGGQREGGTMTAPNSNAVVKCIQAALENAQINASEIDLISGHLSSTMADPIEISNWCKALDRRGESFPYINSTKSLIGHTIGAAGVIETIAALVEMQNHFLHPSLNCGDMHPDITALISENCIPHETKQNIRLNCIAKASFGFGDVNACIILKNMES
jgi:3-oxoacyl-(acyl-carrier-protein) synthase